MDYSKFTKNFLNIVSWVKTTMYTQGDDAYIGRMDNGNLCSVNLRLLYRIAARDGMKMAVDYFLSDAFIRDAYDNEEPGIKLLPIAIASAAVA